MRLFIHYLKMHSLKSILTSHSISWYIEIDKIYYRFFVWLIGFVWSGNRNNLGEESFVLVCISGERFLSIIVEKPRRYLVDQKAQSPTKAGIGCIPELTSTCDLLPPAPPAVSPCPLSQNSATSWDDISKWGNISHSNHKSNLDIRSFYQREVS